MCVRRTFAEGLVSGLLAVAWAALPLATSLVGALFGAENGTKPGAVTTPYPTLINLAVEWTIEGDENLNCTVAVRYRKVGESRWCQAMPLFRVPGGRNEKTRPPRTWTNKLAGSIFDLVPDTEYEIELTLNDPDGGTARRIVRAKTRPVPRAAKNSPTRKVTAESFKRIAPKPGEILLLQPGNYGAVNLKHDGRPGKPIVYRSIDGKAVFSKILMRNRKWVYIEGIRVENRTDKWAGIDMIGAENCVVRRSTIHAITGIHATEKPGAKNCYIADNVIKGYSTWTREALGPGGKNIGEGILLTGPGNVICFNRVSGFRDNISFMEDRDVADQTCIDVYNNDVDRALDDGIEADFAFSNCRILRNRVTNAFMGISSQPSLGGPTYFIRNVLYNIYDSSFKLYRKGRGDVILHNTVVKRGDGIYFNGNYGEWPDHLFLRNNLIIAGPPVDVKLRYGYGHGWAINFSGFGRNCTFDYDALGCHAMPFRVRYGRNYGNDRSAGIAEFKRVEPHGVLVDMGVFDDVAFPLSILTAYEPPDLRPRKDSAVVDNGLRLPNVNDHFDGNGPDIGAYEAGQELPHYGPRPEGVGEVRR